MKEQECYCRGYNKSCFKCGGTGIVGRGYDAPPSTPGQPPPKYIDDEPNPPPYEMHQCEWCGKYVKDMGKHNQLEHETELEREKGVRAWGKYKAYKKRNSSSGKKTKSKSIDFKGLVKKLRDRRQLNNPPGWKKNQKKKK